MNRTNLNLARSGLRGGVAAIALLAATGAMAQTEVQAQAGE